MGTNYWADDDLPQKVYNDSLKAISNAQNMNSEQTKKAFTQMKTGLAPDKFSQLCDRKSSNNWQ